METDDLRQTFCIYCQHEYGNPLTLAMHIAKEHPNTYAAHNVAKPIIELWRDTRQEEGQT